MWRLHTPLHAALLVATLFLATATRAGSKYEMSPLEQQRATDRAYWDCLEMWFSDLDMEYLYGAYSELPRGGVPWAWHESQCRGQAQNRYNVAITGAPVSDEPASVDALHVERGARRVHRRGRGGGSTVRAAVSAARRRLDQKRAEQLQGQLRHGEEDQQRQRRPHHAAQTPPPPSLRGGTRGTGSSGSSGRGGGGGETLFGGGRQQQGRSGPSLYEQLRGLKLRHVLRYARDAVLQGSGDGTRRSAGVEAEEAPVWSTPGLRGTSRHGRLAPPGIHR